MISLKNIMAEAEAGNGQNTSTKMESLDNRVSNGHMLELFKKYKDSNYKEAVEQYLQHFAVDKNVQELTVYNRLKANYKRASSLRGAKLKEYLKKDFEHPRYLAEYISVKDKESPRKTKLRKDLETVQKQNTKLKRKVKESIDELRRADSEHEKLTEDYKHLISNLSHLETQYAQAVTEIIRENLEDKIKAQKLQKQLSHLETEYEEVASTLSEAQEKLNSSKVKNLNKKIKTRDERNKETTEKLKNTKNELVGANKELEKRDSEITDLKASLNNKDTEITKLKLEKQNLQKKLWYENKKLKDNRRSLVDEIDKERLEIEVKKNELEIKEKELDYLQSILEDETIQTFHEGKYNDEIRLCIIELLSMNVSINKVNEVIQTVVKRLTNKKIDKLPSKGLRCQLLIEARHLADIQVGHAMLEGIDLNTVLGNTLHGDGTTKYHRHFQNYQVTTADGKTLSTGLMETLSGCRNHIKMLERACSRISKSSSCDQRK